MNNDNPNHNVKQELYLFLTVAFPIAITNLCRTAMGLTDVSILGNYHHPSINTTTFSHNITNITTTNQTSTTYLAAAGFSVTWFALCNVIFVQGFAAAVTVLGATAFGARNHRLLGYYFLIGLVLSSMGGLCVGGVTYWAGSIMQYFIGFDQHMKELVTSFTRVTLIGFVPLVWTSCMNSFLLAQKETLPQLVTYVCCVGLNIGLNFFFIYGLNVPKWNISFVGFGFIGSAVATAVSRWLQFTVMLCLVRRNINKRSMQEEDDKHRNRTNSSQWDVGFIPLPSAFDLNNEKEKYDWNLTNALFQQGRLKTYLQQACPLALTGVLEDGQLQFIAILAGRLGTVAMATHNGIFQIFWFLSSLMWSIKSATGIRIASYLGSGDAVGAQFAMKIATWIALPAAGTVSIGLVLLRSEIGHVFTNDTRVLDLVSDIISLVGAGYFVLGIFYICMATLSAQGRPHLIAISFVIGAWLVCVPSAFLFQHIHINDGLHGPNFHGLFGLWTSMCLGYGVTSLISTVFVCKSNWTTITEDALKRAEVYDEVHGSDSDLNSQRGGGINRSSGRNTPTGFDGNGGDVGFYIKRTGYGNRRVSQEDALRKTVKKDGSRRHDSLLQPLI